MHHRNYWAQKTRGTLPRVTVGIHVSPRHTSNIHYSVHNTTLAQCSTMFVQVKAVMRTLDTGQLLCCTPRVPCTRIHVRM